MWSISHTFGESNTINDKLSKRQEEIRNIPDSHLKWLIQHVFKRKFIVIYIIIGSLIAIILNMKGFLSST